MAFKTTLFYNISTGQFVLSVTQPSPISNPSWFFADIKHIALQFVQNGDMQGKVSIVPATGIGLQVALGQRGEDVFASVTSAPAVNDVFTFDLPLNTEELAAAMDGATQFNCFIEFKTTDAGDGQRYQAPVTILGHVISDTLTDTPPPDVAIGTNTAKATFVSKDSPAGDFQIWRSASGARVARVFLGEDGQIKADPIT